MVPGTAIRNDVVAMSWKPEARNVLVFLILPSGLWELHCMFQDKTSTCFMVKDFLFPVDLVSL